MNQHRIGMRVEIVDATGHLVGGLPAANPHPEHIGKQGTIVREQRITQFHTSPVILLDDGTELGGWECWWVPIGTKEATHAPPT